MIFAVPLTHRRTTELILRLAQVITALIVFFGTQIHFQPPIYVLEALTLKAAVYSIVLPSSSVPHAAIGVALDAVAAAGWTCLAGVIAVCSRKHGVHLVGVVGVILGAIWGLQLLTLRESWTTLCEARMRERVEIAAENEVLLRLDEKTYSDDM